MFVKRFVKCVAALFFICAVVFAQSEKPKAAVYIKGNPPGREVLRMAVNTFLVKSGVYQMIAVDAIDILAQEHRRQMSGSVSDNEIARLGRDAGAQYVCVVERTELDGISYVATSIVSVQSKIAEFSDMAELPRGEKVISVIERQINAMLGISSGEEQIVGGYEPASELSSYGKPPLPKVSYLRVNGQTEASISLGYAGDSKALTVSTDGGDYDITFLPEWCSVKKYERSFLLSCVSNQTALERSDWFNVTSGDKTVKVRVVQSGSGESSSNSPSSSAAKARHRPAVAEETFNPNAGYFFVSTNMTDSRDYGDVEYHRNTVFGGFGWDIFGKSETRNQIGGGLFFGGGTYGDGVWGFILGMEVKDFFWLVKKHLAVPISVGVDWRPMITSIENRVAAEFIDVMSESDKVSDTTLPMRMHNFDITPTIGLQIFISHDWSIYAGYAYNVSITTDWNAYYKIPGKSYKSDDDGDAFRVPEKYTPLQNVKEHIFGIPGTLRFGLKVHNLF